MFKGEDFKGDYLKFDKDFEINETLGNQIILGPNGVGKTTIYKTIKKMHQDFEYIDYEELKRDFEKNKNKLIIGAEIAELESKVNEKNNLLENLNIRNNFKILNIKAQKDAKQIFPELNESFVNHEFATTTFTNEKILLINKIEPQNRQFFLSKFEGLLKLKNIENEIENLKNEFLKEIYSSLNKVLLEDQYICPVCGNKNIKPIKHIIQEKMSNLKFIQNDLIKDYQTQNINLTPDEIVNNLKDLTNFINTNKITKSDIISYYVCGGEIENANKITNAKEQLKKLNEGITTLELKKEHYYDTLKEIEVTIKETFKNKFKVNSIVFNDDDKNIEITLRRPVDTYSTGEINLMVFTVSLCQFIASNKNILVIDDPLSSYDISNQYRIIFDLVETANSGKTIIILSHNIDCVNITNSQYSNIFSYKYIEKINDILYLKDISLGKNDSILSIDNLTSYISESDEKRKYFELLIEREENPKGKANSIFHYDESSCFNYNGANLVNDYFVSLIDEFSNGFNENTSFEENSINKVIYMTAIRVWIEKQFYLDNPEDTLLKNKSFGQKINHIFPISGKSKWHGSNDVTRKYLVSKKTMINQHNHYKSQILPFNYALNITLDELKDEILDIKSHFQN